MFEFLKGRKTDIGERIEAIISKVLKALAEKQKCQEIIGNSTNSINNAVIQEVEQGQRVLTSKELRALREEIVINQEREKVIDTYLDKLSGELLSAMEESRLSRIESLNGDLKTFHHEMIPYWSRVSYNQMGISDELREFMTGTRFMPIFEKPEYRQDYLEGRRQARKQFKLDEIVPLPRQKSALLKEKTMLENLKYRGTCLELVRMYHADQGATVLPPTGPGPENEVVNETNIEDATDQGAEAAQLAAEA